MIVLVYLKILGGYTYAEPPRWGSDQQHLLVRHHQAALWCPLDLQGSHNGSPAGARHVHIPKNISCIYSITYISYWLHFNIS